jgi:hypothetical protein
MTTRGVMMAMLELDSERFLARLSDSVNDSDGDGVAVEGLRFDQIFLDDPAACLREVVDALRGAVTLDRAPVEVLAYVLHDSEYGYDVLVTLRSPTEATCQVASLATSLGAIVAEDGLAIGAARGLLAHAEGLVPAYRAMSGASCDPGTVFCDWLVGLPEAVSGRPDLLVGPFGAHGVTYGTDEDGEAYATVGFSLPGDEVFAELCDATYGSLCGFRVYLDPGAEVGR